MTPKFLIDQGDGFEWLPFNSFDEVVEALSGLEPYKVYEVEPGTFGKLHLYDISGRAATAWVEKNWSTIDLDEDDEPIVVNFIKDNASNLDDLVGETVTARIATERDYRSYAESKL